MIGRTRWCLPAAAALLLALPVGAAPPEQPPAPSEAGAERSIRESIDSIRDDLVELRFEAALAAIEGLIGAREMTEVERTELLVLRSQAHVAFGDLDAAEQDFREILTLRPGFEPDRSLTPRKALERFEAVRDSMVGRLGLEVEPADARLFVDDRPQGPIDGKLSVLAGTHELRAEQEGYDSATQTVEVAAGQSATVRMQLVPNSRTLVVRTEPEQVEVLLDGQPVGRTERGVGGSGELTIPNVALGEHRIELSRECFRDEAIQDNLTVDLLDRSPKKLRVVVLQPARATVALAGGPDGAAVAVDGREVGRLPVAPFEICPGPRTLDVRSAGRLLWRERLTAVESETIERDVLPRPTLVRVGGEAWPAALRELGERFNRLEALPLPRSVDLSSAEGWGAVRLPPGTDLALAVVPAERQGLRERWYLYSPILYAVQSLEQPPPARERPRWRRAAWGLSLVDSELAGPALVVDVAAGGSAAQGGLDAGARLTGVAGREVHSAEEARRALASVGPDLSAAIAWVDPECGEHRGELRATWTPWVRLGHGGLDEAMELAAWSVVDALVDDGQAAAALANLALLYGSLGRADLAAESWQRVRFGDRRGIGEGTVQYYRARELERLGREEDAVRAYRKAAASLATAFDDEGPLVAPAARDRLADLGVTDGSGARGSVLVHPPHAQRQP